MGRLNKHHTLYNANPPERIHNSADWAHSPNKITKFYLRAVKDVLQCIVRVQLDVPSLITCKLWDHSVCEAHIGLERLCYSDLWIYKIVFILVKYIQRF
jgi:hypothetical protein